MSKRTIIIIIVIVAAAAAIGIWAIYDNTQISTGLGLKPTPPQTTPTTSDLPFQGWPLEEYVPPEFTFHLVCPLVPRGDETVCFFGPVRKDFSSTEAIFQITYHGEGQAPPLTFSIQDHQHFKFTDTEEQSLTINLDSQNRTETLNITFLPRDLDWIDDVLLLPDMFGSNMDQILLRGFGSI
ncbi:hypothetical protein ACFL2B_02580 [Patescibacteria group bacterium]